jgi:hypothetical protein
LKEGPVAYLSDVNVSYKRSALHLVKRTWWWRYNEATVHWALARRGVVLWQRPQIVVQQDRGPLTFTALLEERFGWGRLFAARRAAEISLARRTLYALLAPGLPPVLLARCATREIPARRRARLVPALPAMLLLSISWSLGEMVGYWTGREAARAVAR